MFTYFSLRHFVADAGDYTIAMVDDLLNVLTSGEHSKVMALLEEVRDRLSYLLTKCSIYSMRFCEVDMCRSLFCFRKARRYIQCNRRSKTLVSGETIALLAVSHGGGGEGRLLWLGAAIA